MNSIQITDLQQKGNLITTLQHEEVKDFLTKTLKDNSPCNLINKNLDKNKKSREI